MKKRYQIIIDVVRAVRLKEMVFAFTFLAFLMLVITISSNKDGPLRGCLKGVGACAAG